MDSVIQGFLTIFNSIFDFFINFHIYKSLTFIHILFILLLFYLAISFILGKNKRD